MKKILTLCLTMLFGLSVLQLGAQTRYLDEVFSAVTVTADTTYQTNYSIFPLIAQVPGVTGPVPVSKQMDIYEPTGDTVSQRPLLILSHNGTYFPAIVNGTFNGNRKDSLLVELATRYAKMGYVVATVDNRLGWFLTAPIETQRKTILEATYRAIQDLRTSIRFFRKSAAEDGNTFKIDPDKVALGGSGTGGYLTYAAAFLRDFDQLLLRKFTDFSDPMDPVPYVDTLQLGDIYGVDSALFNIPHYPTYSSDFTVGFCLGGALGDSSWVRPGGPAIMGIQSPDDQFAPFNLEDVLEPINNLSVIDTAAGAFAVITQAQKMGVNDVWKDVVWKDPFNQKVGTDLINAGWGDLDGLYPLSGPYTPCSSQCITTIPNAPADTCAPGNAPYDWIDSLTFAVGYDMGNNPITGAERYCQLTLDNPNDPAVARTYIDSIVGYVSPRMALALGIVEASDVSFGTSIEENLLRGRIGIYPNPARDRIIVAQKETVTSLDEVVLMDITGKVLQRFTNVNERQLTISRNNLPSGMYLIQVRDDNAAFSEKILFE
ncbi:MAG: T9SS type A sorting domain-containing protein [Bacteroidota bacterium]